MSDENYVEDFLEVDKEIPSQKYGVFSFITPEKVLKKKELYFMTEFFKHVCKDKAVRETLIRDTVTYDDMKEKYDDFMFTNEERMEEAFHAAENFTTTISGFKSRGNYPTLREAQVRAEVLRKKYIHDNIFVGQVGYWLPIDPNPDRIENQEYANEQLNNLMKKYNENRANTELHYEQQKEEAIKKQRQKKLEKLEDDVAEEQTKNETQVNSSGVMFNEADPWMSLKTSENV
jgi:hypothetical protein